MRTRGREARALALRALALPMVAAMLAGCPSTSVYRTAEPVADGRYQLSAAAGGGVLRDREQETRAPSGAFELGVRRGVANDVDVGLKLYTFGLDAGATFRIVHKGAWSLALAPDVAIARTARTSLTTNAVHLFALGTLITTYRFSPTWALSFGPALGGGLYYPETGGHAAGAWLGAFVNLEARLGERWWLVPELSGYQVASGEVPLRGGVASLGIGLRLAL